MNKGIIEESYLQKNIDKINFYSNEEKKVLIKISQQFERCNDNYKSTNANIFMKTMNSFNLNVDRIYTKREKYQITLKNVITQYKSLSVQVINDFGEGEYYD